MKAKVLSVLAIMVMLMSLTIIGMANAGWSANSGNMYQVQTDYTCLFCKTVKLESGGASSAWVDWTGVGMNSSMRAFSSWVIEARGICEDWQTTPPVGLPDSSMTILLTASHTKTDVIRLKYEWYKDTYNIKEFFSIDVSYDGDSNWYNKYNDTWVITYDEDALSYYPRHSADIIISRVPKSTNGDVTWNFEIYKEVSTGGSGYSRTLWDEADQAMYLHDVSSISDEITFYVEVDSFRGSSGSAVKHKYWNLQNTRIIGDVNNDRKIDMKDIGAIGQAMWEVCDDAWSTPDWFDWEYFFEDVYADGYINLKDSGFTQARYGQSWS